MILAIDVGGTFLKYSLVDQKLNLLELKKIPTPKENKEELFKTVKSIYDEYLKNHSLEGIAISTPGAVTEEGVVIGISALDYLMNVNIANELSLFMNGIKVIHENDGNCSILFEQYQDKDLSSAISIVLGTGIGGSVLINKEIVRGHKAFAGEFGQIKLLDNKGQTFMMEENSPIRVTQRLSKLKGFKITGEKMFALATEGDVETKEHIKKMFDSIVSLLFMIQNTISPEKAFISGGIVNNTEFETYLNNSISKIEKTFNQKLWIKVKLSKVQNPNLIGVAYKFLKLKGTK